VGSNLMGTTASSLHRLKNMSNQDIAVFVFPDLTVKKEGQFQLRFVLMNLEEDQGTPGEWVTICQCYSEIFTVHSSRTFPGMAESTPLTRMFADQGVRVRLRKDSRQLTTKKQNNNYAKALNVKRTREQSIRVVPDESAEIDARRTSIASPDRSYYESTQQQQYNEVPDSKRQRTVSGGINQYSVRQGVSTGLPYSQYPGMTSTPAPHTSFITAGQSPQSMYSHSYQPGDAFSTRIPLGLPRGGSTRLDTQIPQYQGDLFTSPSGHHSPGNPYAYANSSTEASPSLQHAPSTQSHGIAFFQGGEHQLPALNQALNPSGSHINTSPQAHSQSIHTPVSSTGSPIEGVYTHAAPTYSAGYVTQTNGSYDQGTLRANGINTPVTGDMPSDAMQGSFVPNQILSADGVAFPKPT
jgi:hypothetical protein